MSSGRGMLLRTGPGDRAACRLSRSTFRAAKLPQLVRQLERRSGAGGTGVAAKGPGTGMPMDSALPGGVRMGSSTPTGMTMCGYVRIEEEATAVRSCAIRWRPTHPVVHISPANRGNTVRAAIFLTAG